MYVRHQTKTEETKAGVKKTRLPSLKIREGSRPTGYAVNVTRPFLNKTEDRVAFFHVGLCTGLLSSCSWDIETSRYDHEIPGRSPDKR